MLINPPKNTFHRESESVGSPDCCDVLQYVGQDTRRMCELKNRYPCVLQTTASNIFQITQFPQWLLD